MKFAVAQNAAIIEDDGNQVRYHPRCPFCGYLNDRLTCSAFIGNGIKAGLGFVFCQKCGKSFEVVITRR